ncbi:MAG TPA: plasmid pRiA4b ORF-3 family protein [Steroidobacteraceae bacterium]
MAKRLAAPSRKQAWSWQLRIELLGVSPTVWRRLIVPEIIKLPKLHKVFQTALGWTNSHLHEFLISGAKYADPDPDLAEELEHIDERNIVLVKALGLDARCFDYLYDFGDSWHHVVVVEDQHPHADVAPSLVHCSDGANACPPEDVGGVHGYAEFLEAIADSEHEDHDRYLEWVGGRFDPKRFDLDAANLALSKIKV